MFTANVLTAEEQLGLREVQLDFYRQREAQLSSIVDAVTGPKESIRQSAKWWGRLASLCPFKRAKKRFRGIARALAAY